MAKRKVTGEIVHQSEKKINTHWSLGLLGSINDPDLQVMADEKITAIKDKYPKARYHYLILPKEDISNLKRVTSEHLDLLKHMHQSGLQLTKSDDDHKTRTFKIGYHSEPSMSRLHLHVISKDMDSNCLKTKKHWNSFTTEFFLDSEAVINDLEKNGKVTLPSREKCKQLMETPLKCHKCDFTPKNMPDLKRHITNKH